MATGETFRIEVPITVLDQTEPGVSQATQKVSAFDKGIQKTQERLDKMNKTRYKVTVETLDKATTVIEKIKTSVKGVAGKAWSITMKVADMATAPIRGVINLLKNPILQAGAILGISFGLKDTVDTFSTFESTMSRVKAISGATAEEFDDLTAKAKELGAKTKFTAIESAEAFTYMSMAGWNVQQQLEGIDGIMALSAADGLDLATTADIVTDGLTAFGLEAGDAAHFADVLAAASTSANTNVSMLGESFKNVAPLAGALNYTIEDTSVALGLMANAGVKGGQAGTALRNIIKGLGDGVTVTGKKLGSFTIATSNADGTMRTFKEQMDDLRYAFGELTEAERSATAQDIAGAYGMSGLLAIINTSEEEYLKLTESIYDAKDAAEQMADIMMDNLAGAFTKLQSAAEGVKLTLGERLSPYLSRFANWFTDKMPDIEAAVGQAMDFVDEKITEVQRTIGVFTSGAQWQDADFFGKMKIAWDRLIAEPFDEWWSTTGRGWLADKAAGIGRGLGSGLTMGLSTLLGFNVGGAVEDGISVGASFAEGFTQGFDGKKIWDAVKNAIKGVFKDAATLLPGGEKASGTSLLSTAAIGLVLSKLGVTKLLGKGAGGLLNSLLGGGGVGEAAASVLGGGDPMSINASVVYLTTSSIGDLLGGGGQVDGQLSFPGMLTSGGGAAGAGKVGTTAAAGVSLGTIAGVAGVALGGAGLISAAADLSYAAKSMNEKEKRDSRWSAGAKAGMVGTGALAGAAIGSIVPVLGTALGAAIGAGVGGLGAIFAGSSMGKWFSDLTDGTAKIEKTSGALRDARVEFETLASRDKALGALVTEYERLDQYISSGAGSTEELAIAQEQMKDVTAALTQLYPDLITKYDIERGKLSEKLGLLQDISEAEKKSAKLSLEIQIAENEKIFDKTSDAYAKSLDEVERLYEQKEIFDEAIAELSKYKAEAKLLMQDMYAPDYSENVTALVEQINAISDTVGFHFNGIGDLEYGGLEDIKDKQLDVMKALEQEEKHLSELAESYSELYQAQRDLIELELGGTLEDQAAQFYELDKTQQGAFLDAIANVQDLEREMGFLAESVKLNIDLLTDLMAGSKPSEASRFGFHSSDGITFNAWGGIMTRPHMGIVAEDGPEGIIPLGADKRSRGIALWEETGRILGVTPYAEGGIVGPIAAPSFAQTAVAPSAGTQVNVEVSVNPDFHIDGSQGPEQVKEAILALLPEITDELAGQIGGALAQIFSNMPVKGA